MGKNDAFSADESRQLAVLIARAWADPALAVAYQQNPEAVLMGAGIELRGRTAPQLPAKPDELAAQPVSASAMGSSASSLTCATCPCTGCTASCACTVSDKVAEISDSQMSAIMMLAEDPAGREQARNLVARWDIKIGSASS
jgi:hypothetical protein